MIPARAPRPGAYPDCSGHFLSGGLVSGGQRQTHFKHFTRLGVCKLLAPLGEFLKFVQKTLNFSNLSPKDSIATFLTSSSLCEFLHRKLLCHQWVESSGCPLSWNYSCVHILAAEIILSVNCMTFSRLLDVSKSLNCKRRIMVSSS